MDRRATPNGSRNQPQLHDGVLVDDLCGMLSLPADRPAAIASSGG
jgi:hypothetical protein